MFASRRPPPVPSRTGRRIGLLIAAAVPIAALAAACAFGRGTAPPPRVTVAPPRVTQPPAQPPAQAPAPAHAHTVRVGLSDASGTRVVELPLEEYVLGTVRAELAPDTLRDASASAMIAVQAIVARTYVLANLGRHAAEGFDVCDGTHCQIYRAPPPADGADDLAASAVDATRGQIITFEGRPIQALFHANCGGHTASAASVWGGADAPYLAGVSDWFCSRNGPFTWSLDVSAADLVQALPAVAAFGPAPERLQVEVSRRDASGRALEVTITGDRAVTMRAEAFRAGLRGALGERSLRSAWFTVTREDGFVRFEGFGAGHGVGLCQAGALLRARAGYVPAQILAHYFPGTRIEQLPPVGLASPPAR